MLKDFEAFFHDRLEQLVEEHKPIWNYEAGVMILGAQKLYEITNDEFYLEYMIQFMDDFINEDGTINYLDMNECNLDKINSGKPLFFLYKKTGEIKYKKAIETLMSVLRKHPRTSTGNFWHKVIYPYQIWLDGLYMALPFYMQYENEFEAREKYNDIFNQLKEVRRIMYSEKDKLYIHAYDEKKVMLWADKETGLSHNYWLRSIGWHLMSLIDLYELSSEEVFEQHKQYSIWFKEALKGILEYRDKNSGLFYQLIALPEVEGNYIETSGSAMIAYSILKGCRLGVLLEEKYREIGEEMLRKIYEQKLVKYGNEMHLKDICSVAGLGPKDERDGSIEYYLSEPIVCDDEKGVGAVMLACSEYMFLKDKDLKGEAI